MDNFERELKEAALIGFQSELDRISALIERISNELGTPVRRRESVSTKVTRESPSPAPKRAPKAKRALSAEGRARIAEAARKKWADYRAQKEQGNEEAVS